MNSFKDLYNWYQKISNVYNYSFSDNGWLGLYGVTYKNNTPVATKLYFNIETPIQNKDFPFAENKNLYINLVQHADPDRCFNNCLALKKYNNHIKSYFHIKFKDYYKFVDSDSLDDIALSKYKQGISVEDTIRRYYYVTEKEDIKKILKKTEISQLESDVKYLEVTLDPNKCIVIFPDNYGLWVNRIIESNCSQDIIKDVKNMQNLFGVIPCLFGKYMNKDVKTIYWDLTVKNFYPGSDLYNYIIS